MRSGDGRPPLARPGAARAAPRLRPSLLLRARAAPGDGRHDEAGRRRADLVPEGPPLIRKLAFLLGLAVVGVAALVSASAGGSRAASPTATAAAAATPTTHADAPAATAKL